MTDREQKAAAKTFAEEWKDKGYEKGQSQPFWLSLLRDVLGIEHPEQYISFEDRVFLGHTSFIDGYIADTKVLIEQKGSNKNLDEPIKQSDGTLLTPFQQAKRYITELPVSKHPNWVVTCNFKKFYVYNMEQPSGEPLKIELANLGRDYYLLQFLVNKENSELNREMEISLQAGDLIGELYDEILKQYNNPADDEVLKSLNELCVRLVFCLYAEDAGIFGRHAMFHDYLAGVGTNNVRDALVELFRILDTKEEDRDPYGNPDLLAFPYVNGGLFANEHVIIPRFNEKIVDILLNKCSSNFDWSEISPTIFGAIFESTLNPETRRHGGMHYTDVEDIHKVIDNLFLDDLLVEFDNICSLGVVKTRKEKLEKFQEKLANLKFLDPACGSANFLTESYISLRRLENKVIREILACEKGNFAGQIVLGVAVNPVKVSISQFYGIEINDFAVTVGRTALWIAESQMLHETEEIIHMNLDFLPLKTNAYIQEGNALEIDWNDVISVHELSYIMGNPPFVGGMYMSSEQNYEIRKLFGKVKGVGEFDYVTGWYKKAIEYIKNNHNIKCAFVSTNSVCQGSSVITFWKHLYESYQLHIDFAYNTFEWGNNTKNKAKVHCVIVGFSLGADTKKKKLYSDNNVYRLCEHINPYLTDTDVIFIEAINKPICNVPAMRFGSMPRDGGGFVLSAEERVALIKSEPLAEKWIRPYIGASEFLNNKERYCLWLVGADPSELMSCPTVKKRVEHIREFRLASKAEGTRKFAATPTLFCQIAQPNSDYIIVPETSSGKRRYIPLGFMSSFVIASNLVFLIPNAGLYEFGVLMSNVHNSWMRLVAGRLKSDFRYAKDIVYNNFIWCEPTPEQKAKIEQTAQGILDARALYPKSSLSKLYDENFMPPELRRAHQLNDKAVMEAYGFTRNTDAYKSESACVAALMKLYKEKTQG